MTCFAYGMTGAGKTYTMLGDIYSTTTGESGICSLSIDSLFQKLQKDTTLKSRIKVSYLEIYNEQVKDLLNENPSRISAIGLMLVEDPNKGVIAPELTEYSVKNSKELLKLLLRGNERRTMAATSSNQFSSRSHAILQITLESIDEANIGVVNIAKLSLVDLAGSERAATGDNHALRTIEGGKINRSLLALGNCITILSERQKNGAAFVPYRDSKLTRLLKDSLGGNTKTIMIACVSPAANCYEESINTLKYAERAKMIKNKICRNIKELDHDEIRYKKTIMMLKTEIDSLKKEIQKYKEGESIQSIRTDKIDSKEAKHCIPKAETELMISSIQKNYEDHDIESLDNEIKKATEIRQQCQEELLRDSEDVRKSIQFSQMSVLDDDSYLCKLSQELLNKYEKHHEMKESIQELIELEEKNNVSINQYQREVEELIRKKNDLQKSGGNANKLSEEISEKIEEIEELKRTNETNEEMRIELEQALKENTKIQQKYLEVVTKLQSHRKKDALELQISLRSLRVEKMDLLVENLQMKKAARLSKLKAEDQSKELIHANLKLGNANEQLKEKDIQLRCCKSQIEKQNKEIEELKQYKALYDELIHKTDSCEFFMKNNKLETDIDNSPNGKPKPNVRYGKKADENNNTFVSVSSVAKNYNEVSESDIEVMDNCMLEFDKDSSISNSVKPQIEVAEYDNSKGNAPLIKNMDKFINKAQKNKGQNARLESSKGYFSIVNRNYGVNLNKLNQKADEEIPQTVTPRETTHKLNLEISRSSSADDQDVNKNGEESFSGWQQTDHRNFHDSKQSNVNQ